MCRTARIAALFLLFSLPLGSELGLGCDLWLSPASFVCWRRTRRPRVAERRGRGGSGGGHAEDPHPNTPPAAPEAALAFSGAFGCTSFSSPRRFPNGIRVDRQSVAPSNLVPSLAAAASRYIERAPAGLITLAAPGHLIHSDVAGVTSRRRRERRP